MERRYLVPVSPAAHKKSERWLVASFRPVSLFSLRMTHSTSKGGKTLLLPTPYAVKMALLDACFRCFGATDAASRARLIFEYIKAKEVRVRPPKHCIVNNTFVKVLDRDSVEDPFRQTIAYREFVFFGGDDMSIALGVDGLTDSEIATLTRLFAHINSLGKRGGFFQFVSGTLTKGDLEAGFTKPRLDLEPAEILSYPTTQALDDFGPALCKAKDGFDRVSTYGDGKIKLGEHRTLTNTAVPYGRRSASRHFTWYNRV